MLGFIFLFGNMLQALSFRKESVFIQIDLRFAISAEAKPVTSLITAKLLGNITGIMLAPVLTNHK